MFFIKVAHFSFLVSPLIIRYMFAYSMVAYKINVIWPMFYIDHYNVKVTMASYWKKHGVLLREILGFLASSRVDLKEFYHVFYQDFFL